MLHKLILEKSLLLKKQFKMTGKLIFLNGIRLNKHRILWINMSQLNIFGQFGHHVVHIVDLFWLGDEFADLVVDVWGELWFFENSRVRNVVG